MLYKIIHGLAPSYLTAILPRPRDAGYHLRSFDNMSFFIPSAQLCQKFFSELDQLNLGII